MPNRIYLGFLTFVVFWMPMSLTHDKTFLIAKSFVVTRDNLPLSPLRHQLHMSESTSIAASSLSHTRDPFLDV